MPLKGWDLRRIESIHESWEHNSTHATSAKALKPIFTNLQANHGELRVYLCPFYIPTPCSARVRCSDLREPTNARKEMRAEVSVSVPDHIPRTMTISPSATTLSGSTWKSGTRSNIACIRRVPSSALPPTPLRAVAIDISVERYGTRNGVRLTAIDGTFKMLDDHTLVDFRHAGLSIRHYYSLRMKLMPYRASAALSRI